MSDETTPQDSAAMSPASDGSVVAWAVMDGTKTLVGYHSCSRDKAEAWAREYGFPEVVPLYRQPTSKVVRLPQAPDDFEISEANGYAAAIVDFKRALAEAGIGWTE